jgi:hypothetical protein
MSSHTSIVTARRGQTLIIAIMVMFILAVAATVFILLVARNLARSARMSSTDAVVAIAEAGIRYADEMLTTSEDGADWRPVPDNLAPAAPGAPVDPDFEWLRPYAPTEAANGSAGPTGGYTRFNYGQGRFLLRVSYNPDPNVAISKYIKIECVGRWGVIDPSDPTTYSAGNVRQRREIAAYKPIGITDSLRFITNKDNRSVDAALGVPGFDTSYGRAGSDVTGLPNDIKKSRYGTRGGPIRVNANLLWYGNYADLSENKPSINIFLRGIQADSPADDPTGNTHSDLIPIDGVAVAGDIKVDSDPDSEGYRVQVKLHELIRDASGNYTDNPFDAMPSTDDDINPGTTVFDTRMGFYRDGRSMPDAMKRPRSVKRIEPPLVDQPDPTNTSTRYRVLTLNSGERFFAPGFGWVNLGALGWGKGVYIGNSNDKQDESETIFGGSTLRSDVMEEGNPRTTNWKGPYYVPPAAIITLEPDDVDSNGNHCFVITRTDSPGGRAAVWYDSLGRIRPDWGATVRMPYPDPVNGRVIDWYEGGTRHIEGNGVVFAEGNIRIRGMLPKGMKLTIVSNQNIYIDGSVLKYRDPKWNPTSSDPYRGADCTGGLALLARQNIIVNTTQFFSPLNTIGADDYGTDSLVGGNSSHVVVRDSPASRLRCGFEFGPFESETGVPPSDWYLLVRQSGEYGPAYINAWLNPSDTTPNWGLLGLNTIFPGLPPHVWGVGDPRYGPGMLPPGAGVGSAFECSVFDLNAISATLYPPPGVPNILEIALDEGDYSRSNYWMGGLAVVPMDVRIEAILYAQEGSFFVIPGYWLNPDPADTDPAHRPPGVDPRFPLYGQPADIRIVVDGAVSENLPASIGDVEKWMAKWGRIPAQYGSSTLDAAHPDEGIVFLYDDHVGWPVDDTTKQPVRTDSFGRALPLAPRLPVSGSLVYFGDVM